MVVDYSIHNVTVAINEIFCNIIGTDVAILCATKLAFQALNWKLEAFHWTRFLSSERDVFALQIFAFSTRNK